MAKKLIQVRVGKQTVCSTESAKKIGVTLDVDMNLRKHVSNITKSCYCELRRIAKIRGNLTFDAAASLVRS